MSHTVPCRVCGKPFTPCNKYTSDQFGFNWREVACSTECGAIYLQRVLEARGLSQSSSTPKASTSKKKSQK